MTNTQLKIIKLALFDAEMFEIKKLETFPQAKVMHSPEYVQKISELREKAKRTESSMISFSPRRKTAILVAAIIIIALTLTACAFSEQIKAFFFEISETFTRAEAEGEPTTAEFEQYLPSYIPDNYTIIDNEVGYGFSRIIWYNNDHYIYLQQNQLSSSKLILDTEDSPYAKTIMGNNEIYYINKNNTYSFIWIENGYQFSLMCHGSLSWDNIENLICSISSSKSN